MTCHHRYDSTSQALIGVEDEVRSQQLLAEQLKQRAIEEEKRNKEMAALLAREREAHAGEIKALSDKLQQQLAHNKQEAEGRLAEVKGEIEVFQKKKQDELQVQHKHTFAYIYINKPVLHNFLYEWKKER